MRAKLIGFLSAVCWLALSQTNRKMMCLLHCKFAVLLILKNQTHLCKRALMCKNKFKCILNAWQICYQSKCQVKIFIKKEFSLYALSVNFLFTWKSHVASSVEPFFCFPGKCLAGYFTLISFLIVSKVEVIYYV